MRLVLRERADIRITVLDAMTYAANPENVREVAGDPRYRFLQGDICDPAAVREAIGEEDPDAIRKPALHGGEHGLARDLAHIGLGVDHP